MLTESTADPPRYYCSFIFGIKLFSTPLQFPTLDRTGVGFSLTMPFDCLIIGQTPTQCSERLRKSFSDYFPAYGVITYRRFFLAYASAIGVNKGDV